MKLETRTILIEVTHAQKDMNGIYSLISGYQSKKYRIPRIQSTELKKVNKWKGPSENASIPFEMEKKCNHRGQMEEGTWMGEGSERGKEERDQVLGGTVVNPEDQQK